jgi:hypothetical protein
MRERMAVMGVLMGCAWVSAGCGGNASVSGDPPAVAARAGDSSLEGGVASGFAPNVGQAASPAYFVSRVGQTTLSFGAGEIALAAQGSTATIAFRRAAAGARPAGGAMLPGVANYYLGNDPDAWFEGVPTYESLTYEELYPGVALHYGESSAALKGTFEIAPGADASAISWEYRGARSVAIEAGSGDLVIDVEGAGNLSLREHAPVAWQLAGTERVPVAVRFRKVSDASSGPAMGFELGDYDRHAPLVIDPLLTFSTLLDTATEIAVSDSGVVLAGANASPDVHVVKLNAAGAARIFETTIGGAVTEDVLGVAADAQGATYLFGGTNSNDFPTTAGAFQTTARGPQDAYVTKLGPTGALVYSTRLGGSASDTDQHGGGIAVDASGAAYVTAQTQSTDFPTTAGALQTSASLGFNLFVAKLNPQGSALAYGTYLGPVGTDRSYVVENPAVDSAGNVYLTGQTNLATFPTTAGAFQRTYAGDAYDAFVTKLNATGSALVYSTYIGGSSNDLATGLSLVGGQVVVTGKTDSPDFPVTALAFSTQHPGTSTAAFVARLNDAGTALVYSTYLGTSDYDRVRLATDAQGDVIVPLSGSLGLPATPGAFQTAPAGGTDVVLAKLNPTGTSLVYASYLGGNGADSSNRVAVDAAGQAWILGTTTSTNFPVTAGAYQTGGGTFLAKVLDTETSLAPTADAYVQDGSSAGSNFGSNAQLVVKTDSVGFDRDAYLKLDLTSAPAASRVVLRLWGATEIAGSVNIGVFAIANTTWGESTITWNNRPPLGAALANVTVSGTTFGYYELDVSAYAKSEVAAGRKVIALALHAPTASSVKVLFEAREAVSLPKPTLVVTDTSALDVFPTADAYVRDGSTASTNFGSATSLQVKTTNVTGYQRDAYFRFDVSGLAIGSASLRVFANTNAGSTETVGVYPVADTTWGEKTITWNNRPALGASAISTRSLTGTTFAWYDLDVKSYLLSERAAGRNIVTVALHGPSNMGTNLNLNAREAGDHPVRLTVGP